MKKTTLSIAMMAMGSVDAGSGRRARDLKAEIAAQKQAAAAQKARLDALEQKLNNVQKQQARCGRLRRPPPPDARTGCRRRELQAGRGPQLSTADRQS